MNLFCLLEGHNKPSYHVILSSIAVKKLHSHTGKAYFSRWRLFTFCWEAKKKDHY